MFEIKTIQKPSTYRSLLSTLTSIYNPLGLVSLFILDGRKIIQKLCKNEFKWDEEIPENLRYAWLRWLHSLQGLEKLKVSHCYKPKQSGEIVDCSLHHFSDAGETGYGQVSYLRPMDNDGHTHCALLMGKACVAPLKYVSMPTNLLEVGIKGLWFKNHISISWFHKRKTCKPTIFHKLFFPKYDNFKIISTGHICWSRVKWMRLINERQKFHWMFWLLLYFNMKNYKSIACTAFVMVNIALNLHSYEEN